MAVSLASARAEAQVRVGWSTRIEPAWSFDCAAIARAASALGVRGPVEVGCAEYPRGRWGGMYSYERGVHRIRVRRAHDANEASVTLWHELAHAMQQERGEQMGTHPSQVGGWAAYEAHPLEVEARAIEREHGHRPLVLTR